MRSSEQAGFWLRCHPYSFTTGIQLFLSGGFVRSGEAMVEAGEHMHNPPDAIKNHRLLQDD